MQLTAHLACLDTWHKFAICAMRRPWDPTQVQNLHGLVMTKTLLGLNQSINVKVGALQKLQGVQVWQHLHEISMRESGRLH